MSFYPTEYSVQLIERAKHLVLRIEVLLNLLTNTDVKTTFVRFGILSDILHASIKRLESNLGTIGLLDHDDDLVKAGSGLYNTIEHVATMMFFVEEAISERAVLSKPEQDFIKSRTGSEVSVRKVYRTLDLVFAYFMSAYFGPFYPYHFSVTGITREFGTYRVPILGNRIAVLALPASEIGRTRLWGALAHEAAHHRIMQLPEVLDKTEIKEMNESLRGIKEDLAKHVYGLTFESCSEDQRDIIVSQLNEILCDLSSTMVVGPASPMTLLAYGRPIDSLDPGSDHPPLPVRMKCMVKLLSRFKSNGAYAADLQRLLNYWARYQESIPFQNGQAEYCEAYSDIIEKNFSNLQRVLSMYMLKEVDTRIFQPSKWESAVKFYETQVRSGGFDVVSVINLPWARRLRNFQALHEEALFVGRSPVAIKNEETTLTSVVIETLHRLLSEEKGQS